MRILLTALLLSFLVHILYFGGMLLFGLWGMFGFIADMIESGATFQVFSTNIGIAGEMDIWYFVMTYLALAAVIACGLYLYHRVRYSL